MRILCLAFPLLISNWISAQKAGNTFDNFSERESRTSFERVMLKGDISATNVQQYLLTHLSNFKHPSCGLQLQYEKSSLTGFHFSFLQTYKGIEVYHSEVKVNTLKGFSISSIFDNSFDFDGMNVEGDATSSNIVFVDENGIGYFARIEMEGPFENIWSGDKILFRRDTRSFALPDSTVTGYVFMPDPITSAQVIYGFPYADDSNKNNASLAAQMQQVSFKANYNGGIFTLENAFVRIVDFEAPFSAPVTSATPVFNFNRSQDGFEDVNAFYHINRYRDHVSGLGFNIADGLVEIDAHGFNGMDNSYFSPGSNPPTISFGTGGVDDAEDADVLVHEYGHFLSDAASPGSNVGTERKSLDEGLCDYLCASYSKSLTSFNNFEVYNWDGHNEFWNGRVVNTTRVYPTNLSSSNIYRNGEMWSTALFNIMNEIGRNTTDSLLFESMYGYAQQMSMSDAAYLLLQADTFLFCGAYYCTIFKHLYAQGFLPFSPNSCGVSSAYYEEFDGGLQYFQQIGSFKLTQSGNSNLQIKIFSGVGQIITEFPCNQKQLQFSGEELTNGLYLIQVFDGKRYYFFKWIN